VSTSRLLILEVDTEVENTPQILSVSYGV